MNLAACASACQDETCVFTYTEQGGCLVYQGCSSAEPAASRPSEFGISDDWVTCERFFDVFYDKVISLHNDHFNRYMMLGKDGTITRTFSEIGLSEISRITASMHFIVTPTEGLMQRIAAMMGAEVGDMPESQSAALNFSGGPGVIALYNNNNDDGSMWLSIDEDGLVSNEDELSGRAMFTVCYIGPNKIALHNTFSNRYVMMDDSRLSSSAEHDCCTVPEGTLWKGAHFTVVLPTKAPTGSADDEANIEDDPSMGGAPTVSANDGTNSEDDPSTGGAQAGSANAGTNSQDETSIG